MTFAQRRLIFAVVLACVLCTGVIALLRQDRSRNAAAIDAAQQAQLMRCDTHGKVLKMHLHTPEQNFVLVRDVSKDPNDATTAAQRETTWDLIEPRAARAETLVVQAMLDAACSISRRGWASPPDSKEPVPPSALHLDAPPYRLRLDFADGQSLAIDAGDKHPFDDSLAVRTDAMGSGIALVDGAFLFQLNKDFFALRDKRLVHLDQADITQVALTSNEPQVRPFTLRRNKDDFELVTLEHTAHAAEASIVQPAERDASTALLAAINTLRAKSFMHEAPSARELIAFGLNRPLLVVTLTDTHSQLHTLKIGKVAPGGEAHYFATVGGPTPGPTPVVELPSDYLVDKLMHGSEALRDMRLFAVATEDVQELHIAQGTQALHFVRRALTAEQAKAMAQLSRPPEPNEVVWQLDEQPELGIEQADVDGLIYRLLHLRAESQPTRQANKDALGRFGLQQPWMRIDFLAAQKRPLATLNVGHKEGSLRFVTDDHQQVVSRIFATTTDDIDMSGKSFAAHRPPEAP